MTKRDKVKAVLKEVRWMDTNNILTRNQICTFVGDHIDLFLEYYKTKNVIQRAWFTLGNARDYHDIHDRITDGGDDQ